MIWAWIIYICWNQSYLRTWSRPGFISLIAANGKFTCDCCKTLKESGMSDPDLTALTRSSCRLFFWWEKLEIDSFFFSRGQPSVIFRTCFSQLQWYLGTQQLWNSSNSVLKTHFDEKMLSWYSCLFVFLRAPNTSGQLLHEPDRWWRSWACAASRPP